MLNLRSLIVRLGSEETGQDLVEYALLTAIVGLAGLAVFTVIRDSMAQAYDNWTNPAVAGSVQDIWEPPAPQ
ncbi:MAG: hypothetical protein H0X67_02295 [Acidobacteria bacterium]|nr:hypothetical protein [Acidobacteriota bacterium]